LGNATNRWSDLYLSGNTIFLGGATISTTASGAIGLSGGIEPDYSLVAFTEDLDNYPFEMTPIKTMNFVNGPVVGWTLGATIGGVIDTVVQNTNRVRPVCTITTDQSGGLASVTIVTPGVNYQGLPGLFEANPGEFGVVDGATVFFSIIPTDDEILTVTSVGQANNTEFRGGFGGALSPTNVNDDTNFTVDFANSTVSGSATATGTFGGITIALTFGLKYNDDGDGLIVDESVSSITFDGSTSLTAEEFRDTGLGFFTNASIQMYYASAPLGEEWKLVASTAQFPVGITQQGLAASDISIAFDKYLSTGSLPVVFGGPQTLQAIGNSSVSGNLSVSGNTSVSGNLSVSQTMNGSSMLSQVVGLTPGPEPVNPSEGWIAVADGVTWDPAGNGTKQVLIYLNSVWNILSMTPVVTP
jgi:hypothetical protein